MTIDYQIRYLDDLAEKPGNRQEHSWDMVEAIRAGRDALRAQQQRIESKTNFTRLTRSPEALAEFLMEAQKSDPALKWCVDEACREHPDDEQFDCTDEMHTNCILKWLNTHDGLF